jgi:hypothetical protein
MNRNEGYSFDRLIRKCIDIMVLKGILEDGVLVESYLAST